MQFNMLLAQKLTTDTVLLEPSFLSLCLRYVVCMGHWMRRVCGVTTSAAATDSARASSEQDEALGLPRFPEQPPATAFHIPEHFVTSMASYLLYIGREQPNALDSVDITSLHLLLEFIIIFMNEPQYVRSPHVRAQFAEVSCCSTSLRIDLCSAAAVVQRLHARSSPSIRRTIQSLLTAFS